MKNRTATEISVKPSLDAILQEALEILDAEDGKSFEEKKEAMIKYLEDNKYSILAGTMEGVYD
jgi:hypothetical protein